MKFAVSASSAAAVAAVLVLAAQPSAVDACNHDAVRRATAINADPVQRAAIHHRHFRNVALGKRQASKYPPAGATPPKSMTPKEWLDALSAAERAGKIPNVPQTRLVNGLITYPSGTDVNSVCSWTQTSCFGKNDISKAPDGYWGLNFDDGPNTPSPTLYRFLQQQNKAATFFLIGGNIAGNPDAIKQAQSMGVGNWGVHTWSHTVQTTLSNEEIVAELGWTMQIIYDLTGRIPRFWRPPQGDADNRVRAVAEEVFGLIAVMWDEECNDWCISETGSIATECANTTPGRSIASVTKAIDDATKLPKSPGVILLEHDLTTYSIKAFEEHTWTGIQSQGWNAQPIGNFPGQTWYANAANASSTPSSQTSMLKSAQVAVSGGGSGSGSGSSGSGSSSSSTSRSASTSGSSPSTRPTSSSGTATGAASAAVSAPGLLSGSLGALIAVALGAAALI
ncbi:hypothetical protein OC834_005556 [Tilletia horrida]|nr:hypothetical protein OC834_005556 [Tilletia horrida]KAK0525349.1 hypothetical protein OC835_005645 [Tilletia horrida]